MTNETESSGRYIYDPLYGTIHLPSFVWDVIPTPELQRLREIRLCNINSLGLTGGANVNRYEHAIGTCYLACECLRFWPPLNPITREEQRHLILAALLHDVTSAPFGHSVEYIEAKEGFDHEKAFEYVVAGEREKSYQYKAATLESIFFGMPREMASRIQIEDLKAIGKIIAGKGRLGHLMNSKMDLDNIDNVYRLGYHIGVVRNGEVPLNLARSIWIERGDLTVKSESLSLIEDWHEVRKKLYSLLLLNPEEFSGKCMLTEAVELAKMRGRRPFSWNLVDFEFLERLHKTPPVRLRTREHLFSLDERFESMLSGSTLSQEAVAVFRDNGFDIDSNAKVSAEKDGWRILSRSRELFIKPQGNRLLVSKVGVRGYEVSEVISRLMRGDLYGCVGIFSTQRTDKHAVFSTASNRRGLEDELSQVIRKKFQPRLRSAIIALHAIIDVDKTERQVNIRTDQNEAMRIGSSTNRLLIGVFFKNVDLSMYKMETLPREVVREIRHEISAQLQETLGDISLKEVRLYGEISDI